MKQYMLYNATLQVYYIVCLQVCMYLLCPVYLFGSVAKTVSHTMLFLSYAHRKTIFPGLLAGRLARGSTLANGM